MASHPTTNYIPMNKPYILTHTLLRLSLFVFVRLCYSCFVSRLAYLCPKRTRHSRSHIRMFPFYWQRHTHTDTQTRARVFMRSLNYFIIFFLFIVRIAQTIFHRRWRHQFRMWIINEFQMTMEMDFFLLSSFDLSDKIVNRNVCEQKMKIFLLLSAIHTHTFSSHSNRNTSRDRNKIWWSVKSPESNWMKWKTWSGPHDYYYTNFIQDEISFFFSRVIHQLFYTPRCGRRNGIENFVLLFWRFRTSHVDVWHHHHRRRMCRCECQVGFVAINIRNRCLSQSNMWDKRRR